MQKITGTRSAVKHGTLTRSIVCAAFIVLGVVQYFNFSGFCYPMARWFSDRELLDVAVLRTLRNQGPNSLRSKQYSDIESFYRQNQHCCEISRWDTNLAEPFILRLFGFYTAVASIHYRSSYIPSVDSFYDSIVLLNACGKIQREIGMPTATGSVQ